MFDLKHVRFTLRRYDFLIVMSSWEKHIRAELIDVIKKPSQANVEALSIAINTGILSTRFRTKNNPFLVNATYSEESVTISLPVKRDWEDMVSYRLWGEVIEVGYTNSAWKEFDKICHELKEEYGKSRCIVDYDKEVSINALSAACACWVAGAGEGAMRLIDMSQEGLI